MSTIPEVDMTIIELFMQDPDASELLLKVFRGDIWVNTASAEEQEAVNTILAGFVDGDGSLSGSVETKKGRQKVKFSLSVHQHAKDLQICYLFYFWFRTGGIYAYAGTKNNGVDNSMRQWRVEASNAVWACEILAPKLVFKKEQAKLFAEHPYVMFRETETYAAPKHYAQNEFDTPEAALRYLGAPLSLMESTPNKFEQAGDVFYFIPENDDGLNVRWVRKIVMDKSQVVKYQALNAPLDVITIFPSRTDAAKAFRGAQCHVTNVANGQRCTTVDHVFWSHTRGIGTAFVERSKQDREMREKILRQVQALNHIETTDIPETLPHTYFAGFFAAEGSLIPANKTGAIMTVGQKHRGACDAFHRTYGHRVHSAGSKAKGYYFNWAIYDIEKIQAIFEIWKPYLMTKLRDFRAVLESIGAPYPIRLQIIHAAREASLPENMKTERRDKRRRAKEEVTSDVQDRQETTSETDSTEHQKTEQATEQRIPKKSRGAICD